MKYHDFGPFRVDVPNRELLEGTAAIPLTPRAFDTLLALVRRAGELVDKATLLAEVWPDTHVADATLIQNVYTIRKALREHDADGEYIETLPRRGYRFVGKVTSIPGSVAETSPTAGLRSLAVLPFLCLSSEAPDPFVGLALADALITRLSASQPIAVRPTSSVMEFTGAAQEPVEAGRKIRVDAVLEGRFQIEGRRVRVTVQLVRVRDACCLWARPFEFVLNDLLSVQDDIATRVANDLAVALNPGVELSGSGPTTRDAGAHQAYVKGRYHWNRRSADGLRAAIGYFEEAIERDGNYALAHAGLADSHALLALYASELPRDIFPTAKRAAARALVCDETNAEAHTSMAHIQLFYEWDLQAAEAGFQRAIDLNPGYSTAQHWYAFLHSARGEHDRAVDCGMRALELEPLSIVINADLGLILYFARRYDEAAAQFRLALELQPDFAYALFGLGLVYAQSGRAEQAIAETSRAVELADGSTAMLAALGFALAKAGRREEARSTLRRLRELPNGETVHADRAALIACGLEDVPAALRYLDTACEERSRFVVFLGVWPAFDTLRTEPAFDALVRRVGARG